MENPIARHYSHEGGLLDSIREALRAAGIDWRHLTQEDLTPLDQLHARGAAATRALVTMAGFAPGMHILDIGCGVGGPARFIATRTGCRVTGIDLTPEFVAVAEVLTRTVGLCDRCDFQTGGALALPFPDSRFDGAISQNVTMNIEDKAGFYREAFRVLRPGGMLALAEINQGPGGPALYPTVWAESEATSFLVTRDETLDAIAKAGFEIYEVRDNAAEYKAWLQRQRQEATQTGRPTLGSHIVVGPGFKEKSRNAARNIEEDRVVPVDIVCRKP